MQGDSRSIVLYTVIISNLLCTINAQEIIKFVKKNIMTKMLAPKCPKCNKKCSISGTPRVGSDLNFWTCFDCGYRVEEIEYTEQVQCIKCEEHFDKKDIEKHLEDCGGDAVYLPVCKSFYSDYDAFCDFIEDNHLGSYY